ncbi:MAG: 23S rRNA (uracil(1939)-C(5))-methyltransferase RlmD, partial [Acidimicrobiia bacterium]
ITPPCPVFDRCGGCDWQMISLTAQRRWKARIVAEQLQHLGGVTDPPVTDIEAVSEGYGYRNRIDLRIERGRPGLYAAGSHDLVLIEDCPLVTSTISTMLAELSVDSGVDRVTLRASERTGERAMIRRDERGWSHGEIHELVDGHRFRISGRAFFQVNTGGADALVALVKEALGPGPDESMLDGYAGGGLFSATVGGAAQSVVAIENDPTAVADLRHNVPYATVVSEPFESARVPRVDVAVVDPPRAGLGEGGVSTLLEARPARLAYVSCDPAALARDTRWLIEGGYRLGSVTPVDMFPQTHHIEAVAVYER